MPEKGEDRIQNSMRETMYMEEKMQDNPKRITCRNKCMDGTTLRHMHTASNSQHNVERHMQHPIIENVARQVCGLQYEGQ